MECRTNNRNNMTAGVNEGVYQCKVAVGDDSTKWSVTYHKHINSFWTNTVNKNEHNSRCNYVQWSVNETSSRVPMECRLVPLLESQLIFPLLFHPMSNEKEPIFVQVQNSHLVANQRQRWADKRKLTMPILFANCFCETMTEKSFFITSTWLGCN